MSRPIAKAQWARIRVDVAEGNEIAPRPTGGPFREFAAEFLEHYRATRRPNSFRTCTSHVRIFNLYFGEKRLTGITMQDVQAFQADQSSANTPRSISTRSNACWIAFPTLTYCLWRAVVTIRPLPSVRSWLMCRSTSSMCREVIKFLARGDQGSPAPICW